MMVGIKLNNFQFRYEVYHIIDLFFEDTIQFVEEDYDYRIDIFDNELTCNRNDGSSYIYKFHQKLNIKQNIKKGIFLYLSNITGKELPWGTLIGIRPTKKAIDLLDSGYSEEDIVSYFNEHNCTRVDKARLCIDVGKVERHFVNKDENAISVYVGMPFCPTRCLYCSFISDTIYSCRKIINEYLDAMYYEIEKLASFINEKGLKIECVYFGGGTPTSVTDEQFEETMKRVYSNFVQDKNIKEFTVECGRPDTLSISKFDTMKKYGVNRISINPQTMNDDILKLIGRNHSANDVKEMFYLARKLGFHNINMDIIIGLPGEGLRHVRNTCTEIAALNPESITVHGMSVKRGSKLHENMQKNIKLKVASQQELNEMYEETSVLAERLNMKPYYMYRQKNMVGNMENVGYSKPGKECIYNIEMIEEKQTIAAIGAHSVSKVIFLSENRIERFANVKDVREYINRIKEKVDSKIQFFRTLYN
ncbi:MAG: coproporphyrinogen III oxidase [Bacillota bacterium]|nr:coproporphyrinogen III oxidase [Bacillota bacterium]